jgi:hypothetical protein
MQSSRKGYVFRKQHSAGNRGPTEREKGKVATLSALENKIFHFIGSTFDIVQRIGMKK